MRFPRLLRRQMVRAACRDQPGCYQLLRGANRMMSEYEYLEATARRIGNWLGNSRLFTFVRELSGDRDLLKQIEAAVADEPFFRTKSWSSPISLGVYRCTLYCLTRLRMPALVVETGVLHGLTSRYILRA